MPKIVELPDGQEAEFPDDMDDAAILAVMRKKFPPPAAAAPAPPARFDPTRVAAGPGAIPQGVDVSEAAPTVLPLAAAPFLGAGMAGSGMLATAGRVATSPIGVGVGKTGYDLYRGKDPLEAVRSGAEAALATKIGGGSTVGRFFDGNTRLGKLAALLAARKLGWIE